MLCVTWLIEHRVGFSQGKRCTPCFLVGILMSHKDCTVFSEVFFIRRQRENIGILGLPPVLKANAFTYLKEKEMTTPGFCLFVCFFLPEQINLQIFSSILILRPVTSSYSTSLRGLLSWVHRFHRQREFWFWISSISYETCTLYQLSLYCQCGDPKVCSFILSSIAVISPFSPCLTHTHLHPSPDVSGVLAAIFRSGWIVRLHTS